jgi:hypothetical protein
MVNLHAHSVEMHSHAGSLAALISQNVATHHAWRGVACFPAHDLPQKSSRLLEN